MGAAALPLMIASTAMSGASAYMQSQAVKSQMQASQKVAQNNAQVADWQAQDALDRGEQDAGRRELDTRRFASRQRAVMAANGLDIGSGSALDILADTRQLGDADVATARTNAAREAWGYRVGAANSRAEASFYGARADAENPAFSGATSLLSGASQVASRWTRAGGTAPRSTAPRSTAPRSSTAWV